MKIWHATITINNYHSACSRKCCWSVRLYRNICYHDDFTENWYGYRLIVFDTYINVDFTVCLGIPFHEINCISIWLGSAWKSSWWTILFGKTNETRVEQTFNWRHLLELYCIFMFDSFETIQLFFLYEFRYDTKRVDQYLHPWDLFKLEISNNTQPNYYKSYCKVALW